DLDPVVQRSADHLDGRVLGPVAVVLAVQEPEQRERIRDLERVAVHAQGEQTALRLHRVDRSGLDIDARPERQRPCPQLLAQRLLPRTPPGQGDEHGRSPSGGSPHHHPPPPSPYESAPANYRLIVLIAVARYHHDVRNR